MVALKRREEFCPVVHPERSRNAVVALKLQTLGRLTLSEIRSRNAVVALKLGIPGRPPRGHGRSRNAVVALKLGRPYRGLRAPQEAGTPWWH